MVSGLPPAQSALAVVASAGMGRQEHGSQRINNIGMANVVILKRPVVKESHESAPAKVSSPQDFCPTSQLIKPAVSSIEHSLAQPASRNLERSNDQIRPSPLSPPLPEYNDIKGSAIVADRDEMGGVVPPSEEKQMQLIKKMTEFMTPLILIFTRRKHPFHLSRSRLISPKMTVSNLIHFMRPRFLLKSGKV